MNNWLYKKNDFQDEDISPLEGQLDGANTEDKIYIYSDDNNTGAFLLTHEFEIDENKKLNKNESFKERTIDLPYTVLYKTKS